MDWEIIGLFLLAAKVIGETAVSLLAYAAGTFSLLFAVVSVFAAYRVLGRRRRGPDGGSLPPVTILKPLKGVDRELYESLRSFCTLDYPRYQLLFTLASPDDPALPVISRLRREFPSLDIEIIVSKNRIGFNPKINNLSNSAPFIKHDLILMSDSDIRVEPDFLKRAVAPFEKPGVGLVTCFYRSSVPAGLWGRLEALSVNAHFLPQALTAAAFGMRFAMGAAMLVRREAFEKVGGFQAMAEHLADDFILGELIQAAGYELEIAGPVVESVPGVENGLEHLRHQARWARTIRICHPAGYLGTLVLHGFSLLTLRMALFGFDKPSLALAALLFAVKAACQARISRLCRPGRSETPLAFLLIPLSEWVAFCAWLSGYRSTRVLWRGELYTIESQGRLSAARPSLDVNSPVAADLT